MISFIIPIYNAENILWDNYKILTIHLDDINQEYEILFADDASIDRSKDILEKIADIDRKVRIFFHHPNQGLGFTLRELFRYAKGDIVIYMDVDLPFGIENLPKLLREIGDSDVVLASRYVIPTKRVPIARAIASRAYYFLCKILFDISVKDLGSGFVIFKRKVIDSISLSANGFDIHIELFTKIKRQGFSVKEIPAEYNYNGYSTFSVLRHGPRILINTLRFWLENK